MSQQGKSCQELQEFAILVDAIFFYYNLVLEGQWLREEQGESNTEDLKEMLIKVMHIIRETGVSNVIQSQNVIVPS